MTASDHRRPRGAGARHLPPPVRRARPDRPALVLGGRPRHAPARARPDRPRPGRHGRLLHRASSPRARLRDGGRGRARPRGRRRRSAGAPPGRSPARRGVGIEPTGSAIDLPGFDVMRFDADGRVTDNVVYYDGATFARQIGMLPRRDSAADRAMLARVQRGRRRPKRRFRATAEVTPPAATAPPPRPTPRAWSTARGGRRRRARAPSSPGVPRPRPPARSRRARGGRRAAWTTSTGARTARASASKRAGRTANPTSDRSAPPVPRRPSERAAPAARRRRAPRGRTPPGGGA